MIFPKGRILCADDDADTRDLITTILNTDGFEVVCTDHADQALELAKHKDFVLYLLDHWMPHVSGVDLTRALRQFDSHTPILFFSGAARYSDERAAQDAGAQGYLVKPASPDKLLDEVNRLLSLNRVAD